jgi:3-phenylpropionate/trans-cinnamate dioxygenase ferredoxin reductase subunit
MKVVIIGTGHAGIQAAATLREEGFEGEIVLISDESDLPYQKPPLSKGYLQGKQSAEAILFRSENFYVSNAIDLKLGVKISSINPAENNIQIQDGDVINYSHLILATGAQNRKLNFKNADIFYLRTKADAKNIEAQLEKSKNVVIIGGGFIGLELAALAQEKGKNVTVIEAQSRLMERVLPAVISDVFQQTHEQKGVTILLNTFTENVENTTVTTKCGKTIDADFILAGIGVIPEISLALNAGIVCDNGILVNEFQQTSVDNIYAIGDCANHFNVFANKNIRLESVQNAVDQAKVSVSHILGKAEPYRNVPWFWTNQYNLKLNMAGISMGFDNYLIRGDELSGKFSVYYFTNNKLIGVDSLNKTAEHLNARNLITAGITPSEAHILDSSFNLNAYLV